ncbi:hypothetical protein GDO78_022475 [Eleutherodactylus coqui]|uniref:Uncharacterized protein n=1 Tax=Eleutherodactylus coqui TaxID=57060 RepID=A0A8J6B8M9_ELECQ|nr:hypothetical protein GDO78_022475 [Eleutherodactylus coqui]
MNPILLNVVICMSDIFPNRGTRSQHVLSLGVPSECLALPIIINKASTAWQGVQGLPIESNGRHSAILHNC